MFNNIRIVLVATTHPGNIGATARAMKNMGLSRLYLVQPKIFPHVEATARAAGADDLLANAVVAPSLDEALRDCHLVVGTSARTRDLPLTLLDPHQAAEKVISLAQQQRNEIALVFGRESSGLSNEELQLCHYHLHIPTNQDFSSLNIAAAVQIVVYEIMQVYRNKAENQNAKGICFSQIGFQDKAQIDPSSLEFPRGAREASKRNVFGIHEHYERTCNKAENQNAKGIYDDLATMEEMQFFYTHLEKTLIDIGYFDPQNPRKLMPRLRRLFNRIRLEHLEVNVLRGILTDVQKICRKK